MGFCTHQLNPGWWPTFSTLSGLDKRALFSAARDIAGADHDLTPEEGSILGEIAVRFV